MAKLTAVLLASAASAASAGLNILHIISDDLRPEFGAYGFLNRHTPNLDRIAANATIFDRAYAQQAICGPSRNSFLTGRRPDRSRTWNFINHFREDHPEWTSLPGMFLKAGSKALASGKTYHPKMPPLYDSHKSWSKEALPYHNPCWNTGDQTIIDFQDGGLPCVFCPVDIKGHLFHGNTSVANDFCQIDAYEDVLTIDHAVKLLRKAKDKHFYLAVGMHKPHTPWQAAKEDWDKHPLESIDLPKDTQPPKGAPAIAFHMSDNSVPEERDPWHPLTDEHMRLARRGYRAALTGMDRKLGKLLDELDKLGLADKTAIIVNADHGWSLGEHGQWQKMTNYETTTNVPLIIKVPGMTGGKTKAIAELVDLYPTIAELAGLQLPEGESFDGKSLMPVLKDALSSVKDHAFSQYPRLVKKEDWKASGCHHHDRHEFTHMGYTVRSTEFRYTEWFEWNQTLLKPIWSKLYARELYDHRNVSDEGASSFNNGENENVVDKEEYAAVTAELSKVIRAQFDEDATTYLV